MPKDTARAETGWYLLGPAFVAAIAYVDPGNVAANVSAGAQFGFLLVWVIVVANVMAGLVQYLSAKLGLVTGRSLPEAIVGEVAADPPDRLLDAGRIGRHGNRSRRGGRRRDRTAPAVRPAAAGRRRDHRGGVAAALAIQNRRGQQHLSSG